MTCRDSKLINKVKNKYNNILKTYTDKDGNKLNTNIEFPLDQSIINELNGIYEDSSDDYYLFNHIDEIKKLWKVLIEKSIKCLRYFDTREPFKENPNKHPVAYGVNELQKYFEKYCEFEKMLYGGGKYYRDHVIHVFRVWLLGIDCLLDNNSKYLDNISIDNNFQLNSLEKISIWTMIALTHDLGYPLEKSQSIINTTKDMMQCFIQNPILSMDLSFNGVQNNMNDFVLRFISSKMVPKYNTCTQTDLYKFPEDEQVYAARLQPKYYFKFQKSLEKYMHGTISSIIIYKLLLFFLESDFNINEDYYFNKEDARQFYIRREILRAIASHTCKDIYHLKMESFSFLLIVTDDCQEWGRKNISELYVSKKPSYEFGNITIKFNEEEKNHLCSIDEEFTFEPGSNSEIKRILASLKEQFDTYSSIFRDGQDTKNRDFTFSKTSKITVNEERKYTYTVNFSVSNDIESEFTIELSSSDVTQYEKEFGDDLIKEVYNDYIETDGENKDISDMCKNRESQNLIRYTLKLNGKD